MISSIVIIEQASRAIIYSAGAGAGVRGGLEGPRFLFGKAIHDSLLQ